MRDQTDREAIQQDLQRYRAMLKSDTLDPDATKTLQTLVEEAEARLAQIERLSDAAARHANATEAHRLREPRQKGERQDEHVIHLDKVSAVMPPRVVCLAHLAAMQPLREDRVKDHAHRIASSRRSHLQSARIG
jgi:hypothetical protein